MTESVQPPPTFGALQGLDALELRPGHTVLIFGASGAVSTMAVQFLARVSG
jgi:NADPH:quinone reductase-like Zn-dependent oxidoreductase